MSNRLTLWPIVAAIALSACGSSAVVSPSATVDFVVVALLCSSILPVEFTIDGLVAGTDTFRIALPNPHTRSRDFAVSPGSHTLGARVVGGTLGTRVIGTYVWPDTTVTTIAAAAVADSLPFYCS